VKWNRLKCYNRGLSPVCSPGIHKPEYLKSEKIADKDNPAMWADPWAAAIMEAQGHENPLAQSSQNKGPTPKATKPNPAPLSVDDIIDNISKNKYERPEYDPSSPIASEWSEIPDRAFDALGLSYDLFEGVGVGIDVGIFHERYTDKYGAYLSVEFGFGKDRGLDIEKSWGDDSNSLSGDFVSIDLSACVSYNKSIGKKRGDGEVDSLSVQASRSKPSVGFHVSPWGKGWHWKF
jgi:hypothetical protein